MGFYHPATLVKDAQRHGVIVRPIDIRRSYWRCTWEPVEPEDANRHPLVARPLAPGTLRLGLRYVKGLNYDIVERLVTERSREPFQNAEDLQSRLRLSYDVLNRLAKAGALSGYGLTRREALWQVSRLGRPAGPLFEEEPDTAPSPLREMSPLEETVSDFGSTGLTTGPHPVAYARTHLKRQGVVPTAALERMAPGTRVRFAGSVIVRQRPGTANGLLFITLEDETGMAQAVVSAELLQEHRQLIVGTPGLVIEGILQKRDGSFSIKAERFWPLDRLSEIPSHDFR